MVDSRDITITTESGDVVMEKDKDIVCEARMELLILMIQSQVLLSWLVRMVFLMLLLSLLEKFKLGLGENHGTSSGMYKYRGRLERTEK